MFCDGPLLFHSVAALPSPVQRRAKKFDFSPEPISRTFSKRKSKLTGLPKQVVAKVRHIFTNNCLVLCHPSTPPAPTHAHTRARASTARASAQRRRSCFQSSCADFFWHTRGTYTVVVRVRDWEVNTAHVVAALPRLGASSPRHHLVL